MGYSENTELFDAPCREIQNELGIRFAAIIDHNGKKIAGGFKEGIIPLEGDEQRLQDFFKIVVDLSLKTTDFSNSLGALNYISLRKDKVILIIFPFPITEKILLISAEPNVETEKLASRIVNIFSDSSLSSD
ncbi:uncharacterized protein METZ01_LOCUS482818 [marine metagenome]|uniref:Roadblock/LAMTOR2 domain-containing protein n=1 Tax=marine metagenome TaxID=408172 RepID=A0A383CCU3_9ZZZZ|tara:strand:+ start:912 stop:1307 length:396 start_codon:yes stop_codon:yes gene_type:complete